MQRPYPHPPAPPRPSRADGVRRPARRNRRAPVRVVDEPCGGLFPRPVHAGHGPRGLAGPAALADSARAVHLRASGRPRLRIVVDVLARLAIMVVGMLVEHRREQLWQAELRRRAELARSGAHWRLLDEAARGLDAPALQARLEAVEALRDVAGDFPILRAEVRGLLAARLRERGAAYRDRAVPPDLREM